MQPTNIEKAKARLILEFPFFASILLGMEISEDTTGQIPTMATNGEWIKYNPKFMDQWNRDQTVFILAHEVMHCVFEHMYTLQGRDAIRWNVAGDYVINQVLQEDKVGEMPTGLLHDPKLYAKAGGTTAGIYELLNKKYPPKFGNGEMFDKGGSLDEVQSGAGKNPEEQAAKQSDMKVRVAQAANEARMRGKLSEGLKRLCDEMLKPKVNWKETLRRFLTSKAKVDWSYARPKRRWLAEDINLPSLSGVKMNSVVVAVDCSGSIGDKELADFSAEIRSIIQDVIPEHTHVLYFDSEVIRHDSFASEEEFKIRPAGGGGTAFSPIFKYVRKQGWDPAALVVLTDLQCSDFGPSPEYPVLWTTTDLEQAPFGEIIKMKP